MLSEQLIVDCIRCRARINKDTIMEFLKDIADCLDDSVITSVFEYLEDGSVGFAILEKGFVIANYVLPGDTVRVEIYYRTTFDIPELDDRLNLYFIPESVSVKYKEMR